MTYRDGDVLMLTQGEAAGCLVLVSNCYIYDVRIDRDVDTTDWPFYADELCNEEFLYYYEVIAAHDIAYHGEFPLACIKLGRWK